MTETDLLDSPEAGGTAIRGTLVRSTLFAAGMLVSFATVPFLIRHLGPVDYGYYVTVSAIVFVIAGVTEGGLTTLGVRHYAAGSDPHERAQIVRNVIGFRLLVTTAAVLAVTAVAAAAGAAREIVVGIPLYGAGALFTMISATYAIPLQAQLRWGITSGLEFLRQLLNSGGTVALVVAGAGLYAFFGLWAVVCAIVTVVTAAIVRNTVSVIPAFHWPTWRRYLGEALAYGAATAAGLIYFRMAAALMAFLSTEHETGYFGLAFRVLETGTIIPWLLATSVFPILARAAANDHARLRYATQRVVEVGLIVGVALTLVLVAGAEPIVSVVGGDEFGAAVPVLQIQAVVLTATVFVSTWSLVLLSLDEQRLLLAINGIAVVCSLAAAFVLIPAHGAIGGSLTVLIAEALVGGLSVLALWRRHAGVAPNLLRLWKVVVAAAAAFAAWLPLGDIAGTVAAAAVYAAVLLALRAVPTELWAALRGQSA
jgi:O-antigen/teichoic acid export membrane protein